MRITDSQQSSNNNLTKWSKMTEEEHRRHGMNGSADGGAAKDECPRSAYSQGGRLKFFKDGKFILELERAREGERVSWVSVPRKTYWPPQGNVSSTPTYRQESSTSLSVSDDNSSIQSSPWQRDHSWKQTTPKRNLSKEMTFCYWRSKRRRLHKTKKFRRPYEEIPGSERTNKDLCNNKVRVRVRPNILTIVQMLNDKCASNTTLRIEAVVSPRKRFLREMEKDKVQLDDACQKRSRNRTQPIISPAKIENGMCEEVRPQKNCSYSITSLLAADRKHSPDNSPSHFSPVTKSHYCSSPPEDPWYSESVDRLRSIELSHADKRALYPTYPYMPPYMYPYSLPPYYSPGIYGRNYVMPPVYHAPPGPMHVRHDGPSCSYTKNEKEIEIKEEGTDMPLNLSKHAG